MNSPASFFQKTPAVMGILNLTPDSFSDAGKYLDHERALDHSLQMCAEGAELIDVGAESTRPGAEEIDATEQWKRLEGFFEKIFPRLKVPVSIDTRNPHVARMALQAGASVINDVSALSYETEEMLKLLQESEAVYILMHSRGNPKTMSQWTHYENILGELDSFFERKLALLCERGVKKERIVLDPGIGFAKTAKQSLEILSNLKGMKKFGCPVLVGLSRKSFLNDFFGSEHRERGTELSHWLALTQDVDVLRAHDVKAAKQTIHFFEEYQKRRNHHVA